MVVIMPLLSRTMEWSENNELEADIKLSGHGLISVTIPEFT